MTIYNKIMQTVLKLRWLFVVAVLASATIAAAQQPVPGQEVPLSLSWSNPGRELGAGASFNVYFSPIGDPASQNWTLVTNVPGTMDTAQFRGPAGGGLFAVTTSNYWGELRPQGRLGLAASSPITVAWNYPAHNDPDLSFKVYHSQDSSIPMEEWQMATNVPGTLRAVTINLPAGRHLFALIASNPLGDSDFSEATGTPALPSSPSQSRLAPMPKP
jgi:hypothetical protein